MNWQTKSATPPPGYRYGPRYRASRENIIRGILYILLGRPRSLARDALFAIANMPVPPLVRGEDHIPETGPFVVLANHYERSGLWMLWPALLVGHLVRERSGGDTHWIAIEEWQSFSLWGIPIPPPLIRRVFMRTFRTYGIIAMPAPDASTAARASAMRAAVQRVRNGQIIGIMPEGDVGPTPELLAPREGVGSFLLLLAAASAGGSVGSGAAAAVPPATALPSSGGTRMVPVGLYEEDERLVAQVGPPFELVPPPEVSKQDRDRWARDRVMLALRDLLPEPLWGTYRK